MLPKVWNATGRLTTLSVAGITNILDSLPSAAILISSDEHVLAVNILGSMIIGYTIEDVIGLKLSAIFPNLIGRFDSIVTINRLPDRSLSTVILTKSNERVPITMHLQELAGQDPHYLITFEKISEKQRKKTEHQRRMKMLTNIERLFQAVSDLDSIEKILTIGSQLLIANTLTIYLCGNDSPVFSKTHSWGNTSELPKEISPTDLRYFLQSSLWLSTEANGSSVL